MAHLLGVGRSGTRLPTGILVAVGGLVGGLLSASGLSACLSFSAFSCQDDTQCDLAGPVAGGACVDSVGYCAYPDMGCPSGLRFDDAAGDGLGGECVGDGNTGPGTGDGTVGDDGGTEPDPTAGEDTTVGTTPPTTTDPTGPGSDTGEDTVGACGGGGQDCCAGDMCDAGLQCMGSGCGCVASLAAGTRHTCAIKLDGSVWCWGANDLGQLGTMDEGMSPLPVAVPADFGAGMGAQQISAREHTCATRESGVAVCWGHNGSGKADPLSLANIIIPTLATWSMPATTVGVGQSHTCMGRDAGLSTSCWGDNASGQLTGALPGPGPFDSAVPGFEPNRVVAGTAHTCASSLMGSVYCWGNNGSGQLARDPVTTPSSDTPLPVTIGPIGALASGNNHVCARVGNEALCWGANDLGQLGDGTGAMSSTPVPVALPLVAGAVSNVVSGPNHACALVAGGVLYCWGSNDKGQLMLEPDKMGNDMFTLTPVLLDVGATVLEVATGGSQTCVRTDQGEVLCWGVNDFGQNGDGTTNYGFSPTPAALDCP